MDVEINNRLESCRDMCPYTDILTDVEEYKSLSGTCMVILTIACEHEGVCRYRREEGDE